MLSQKFDLNMKVTNTKNSALGRVLLFGLSHIGRISADKLWRFKTSEIDEWVKSGGASEEQEAQSE